MYMIYDASIPVAVTFDKATAEEFVDKFPGGRIDEPFDGRDMVYLFKTNVGFTYRIYATSIKKAWEEFQFESKGFSHAEAYDEVNIIGMYSYGG